MTSVTVHILHAFEQDGDGGNPAAVVLDADALSANQKLAIAAQVRLSETAFVSSSTQADFKLEFFTPTRQIAHCGHATIATFSHLRQTGRLREGLTSKETIDGCRSVLVEGGSAFMEQLAPQYVRPTEVSQAATADRIASSIGLPLSAMLMEHPPVVCSTGNRFLLLAVRDVDWLGRLQPQLAEIEAISNELDLVGYYAWVPGSGTFHATTRMFAPRYGIPEEAATGMAAGPLAGYLWERCGVHARTLLVEQGRYMSPSSPSRIEVRLESEGAGIRRLFVGGRVRYGELRKIKAQEGSTADRAELRAANGSI
jgi:PhzF family phenazine biosynthesis protein